MNKATTAGVFWCFLATGVSVSAQIRSETQVDVVQGQLARGMVSLVSDDTTEGRVWWAPERGGSAWVKWQSFQVGPLQTVSGPEGTRRWGPGTGLGAGNWGLAFDGPVGVWAVQKPATYELGVQLRGQTGAWAGAVGADRRWFLDRQPSDALWTDEARAGLGWSSAGLSAGAQAEGRRDQGGALRPQAQGRLGYEAGPWEASLKGSWDAEDPWGMAMSGGWKRGGNRVTLGWDREHGTTAQGAAELRWAGLVWGMSLAGRSDRGEVTGRGGAWVSGRSDGVWKLGGSLRPQANEWIQEAEASWKTGGFDAQAVWTVRGRALGWFGNQARFALTLKWSTP